MIESQILIISTAFENINFPQFNSNCADFKFESIILEHNCIHSLVQYQLIP